MRNKNWHPFLVTLKVGVKYWLYYANKNSSAHLYELKKITEKGYCFVNPVTGDKFKNQYFYPSTTHVRKKNHFVFFISSRMKIRSIKGEQIL